MPKQDLPPVPTKKTPIFVGKSALVRLINGNDPATATIWLVDSTNKTLRPFVSEDKFDQMFNDPEQAKSAITTLSSDELGGGGLLGDFHVLNHEYGVQKDGSMKKVAFSPSQLQGRYGKPIDTNAENSAISSLDSMLSGMTGQNPQGPSPTGPTNPPLSPPTGPQIPPQPSPTGPNSEGSGGPGSGTVYNEPGMIYDGQGGPYDPSRPYNTDTGQLIIPDTYGKTETPGADATAQIGIKNQANTWEASGSGSSIPANFIQSIINDPVKLAGYIGAVAYGGYQMSDIYTDMSAQYQGQNGSPSLKSLSVISPTMSRTQYMATPEGQTANTIAKTVVPKTDKFYSADPALTQYNPTIPDTSAYGSYLTPGTPEYTSAIQQLKSDFYDVQTGIASATTEADATYQKGQYDQLRQDALDKLGVTLGDNASQAWTQLDGLDDMYGRKAYGRRGIQGSGIEQGEQDDILNAARRQDKNSRLSTLNQEDNRTAIMMHTYGTPAQIAALTPEQRISMGLTPSSDVINKFSISNIMANNPSYSQADAQAYHDSVLDENGNYRSTIYNKFYSDSFNNNVTTAATNAAKTISTENDQYLANVKANDTGGNVVDPLVVKKPTETPWVNPNTTPATPPTSTPPAVKTPTINPTSTPSTVKSTNPPSGTTSSMYTVKPGDTLSGIYGNNWKNLSGYTGDPTKLQVGAQLPIPPKTQTPAIAPKVQSLSPYPSPSTTPPNNQYTTFSGYAGH